MNVFTDCNDCEFYWVCSENMPNKPCEDYKKELKEELAKKQST